MSNNMTDDPLADSDGSTPAEMASVADAQAAAVASQMRVARALERQAQCRGFVAVALQQFQRATSATTNFESLAREHIRASNQERADRIAGKIPTRLQRRLGSEIDRYAFYTKAQGRGAGGGAAFRRGASTRRILADAKAFPGSGLPQIKETQ